MRTFTPAMNPYLAAPGSFRAEVLLWLEAKNRTSGLTETIGFWTGAYHCEFTINGVTRLYYGAGNILNPPSVTFNAGFQVETVDVEMSSLTPEVIQAVRLYDPRQRLAEMHRAFFDVSTENLIEEPHRVLKGRVNKAPIVTPAINETASLRLSLVTNSRSLTRRNTKRRSDDTYQVRTPGDRINKYAAVSGKVEVVWGESSGTTSNAPPSTSVGGTTSTKSTGDRRPGAQK